MPLLGIIILLTLNSSVQAQKVSSAGSEPGTAAVKKDDAGKTAPITSTVKNQSPASSSKNMQKADPVNEPKRDKPAETPAGTVKSSEKVSSPGSEPRKIKNETQSDKNSEQPVTPEIKPDMKTADQGSIKPGSEPQKTTPSDKTAGKGSEPNKQTKETPESKKEAEKSKTPTQKEKDEKLASWIEKTVEFGIQKDRKDAINRMQTIKDPDVRAQMGRCLINVLKTDSDAELLVKALSVTGEMKVTEAADAITPHINHESEDVRIAAVTALREIKAVQKKDDLVKKLKEQDTSVDSNFTEALIQSLGDFKANELAPWAQEHISNIKTSKIIRVALVIFLGKSGSAADKEFLVKLYRDENEELNIRSYAVNSISKLGLKEASPDIKQVLSDIDSYPFKKKKSYYNLYLYSIVALVKLGDAEAIPRLMDAMKSNNTGVRVKAIDLIKEFNDKRTIDILQYKMKYDPEPKVRNAARKALKELGIEVKDEEKEAPGPEGEEEKGKKNDES